MLKSRSIFSRITAAMLSAAIAVTVYVPAGGVGGSAIQFDSSTCGVCDGANGGDNNYDKYDSVTNSYLHVLENGDLMRVQGGDGEFAVEYFTSDEESEFKLVGCKHIPTQLPLFGGFYAASDGNYYVLTGQKNPTGSDAVEVFRITRYDQNWEPKDFASLSGANTRIPFERGGAVFAESSGYLIIRTCHTTVDTGEDGNIDQAVVMIQYCIDEEAADCYTITDALYDNEDRGGFVYHSLGQKLIINGGKAVSADHSDNLPRGISLSLMKKNVSGGKIAAGYGTDELNYSRVTIYDVPGKDGNIETGVSLGGFEMSASSYIVAINSIDISELHDVGESGVDTNDYTGTRNVYVIDVPINGTGFGEPVVRPITEYEEGTKGAGTPKLVKLGDNSFMLLWQNGKNVCWTMLNGSGEKSGEYSMAGQLSDCQPVVYKNKVVWYTYKGSETTFYSIPVSNPSAGTSVTETTGHKGEFVSCTGGVATLRCIKCDNLITQTVPTTVKVYSNTDGGDYYFEKNNKEYYKTGEIVVGLTDNIYISYHTEPSNTDNSEVVLTDYDESMLSFDSEAMVFTPLKVGRTSVTFAAKYNPSATYTIDNIKIDGQCSVVFDEGISVTTADGTEIASGSKVKLDDEITVKAVPPEGKKLGVLKVNDETIKDGDTFKVSGETVITIELEDKFKLTKPDTVTVTRGEEELSDGAFIDTNETLFITAVPPVGKNLDTLTVNGSAFKNGSSYTVKADTVIEVSYVDKFKVTIPENVTVKRGADTLADGDYIDTGDKLTITVTVPEGKRLLSLKVGETAINSGAVYTVKGDTVIAADFADKFRVTFPETVTVKRSGKAMTSGDYIEENDKLVITATPPEGQRLVALYVNDEPFTNGATYTVKGSTDVKPDYGDKYRISLPTGTAATKGGKPLADNDFIEAGDKLVISAVPADNQRLVALFVNGNEIKSGASYTVVTDTTVTVEFAEKYKVTFGENITVKKGTKVLESGDYIDVGDKLVITAVPAEGKRLTEFYVNDNEFKSGSTYTVSGDTEVFAVFADKYKLILPEGAAVKRNNKALEDGAYLDEGDKLVITALPGDTERLVALYANDDQIISGSTYTVTDGDVEVFVEFAEKYKVSFGENIVVKKNNTALTSGDYIDEGDKLLITTTPPEGKRLDGLYVNDVVEISDGGTYVVDGNVVITAGFADKYKVYFPENVTVKVNNTEVGTGTMIDVGDKLTITATPPEGKRLVWLKVNGTEIKNGSTYVAAIDTVVTVEFADKFKLSIPENVTVKKGNVALENGTLLDEGDKLTVTAVPPEGKRVLWLRVNGNDIKSGDTHTVASDVVVTVEFADKFRITVPENVTVKNGTTVIANGAMIDEGDKLTVTAAPPEGKRLVSLQVNGADIKNGGTYTVSGDTVVSAEFADKFKLTVPENVTVKKGSTVLEDGSLLDEGDKLTITATPPEGFRLVSLKVNDADIKNGGTHTVSGDTVVAAEFADKYTLTIPEDVTVKKGTAELADGAKVDVGDKLTITAVPPEGKRLVSLKVNGTEIKSGASYTVSGDTTVTVEFEDRNILTVPENVTVKRSSKVLADGDYIDPGDKLTITASAPNGKNVSAVKVNDAEIKNGSTYTVTGDTVIEVEYTDKAKITVPDNVTVTKSGKKVSDGDFADIGDKLVIKAVSPAGRNITGLFANGTEINSGDTYTVEGNTVITVTYENGYLLSTAENITVTRSGKTLADGSSLQACDELVISAAAPYGQIVSALIVNGDVIENGSTYTVIGDTKVTAEYAEDPAFSHEIAGEVNLTGTGDNEVKVELYDEEGNKLKTTETEDGKFSFDKLTSGRYQITLSGKGFVPRTYIIDVGEDPVDLDTELRVYGDITGDGTPDAKDATQILRYAAGASSMIKKTGEQADPYLISVGCIKSTDFPDSKDANQILRFKAGMTSLLYTLLGLI